MEGVLYVQIVLFKLDSLIRMFQGLCSWQFAKESFLLITWQTKGLSL